MGSVASKLSGAPTAKWESLRDGSAEDSGDLATSGARLLVRRPGVPEVEVTIDRSEFIIGRQASEVDLVVEDEWVSRKHARLSMNERGYFVLEDLGSQNGIRFQDRPVRKLNLMDGDVFSIGRTEFTFLAAMGRRSRRQDTPAKPEGSSSVRGSTGFAEPPEPEAAEDLPEEG